MDNGNVVSSGSTGTLTPSTIRKLGQSDEEERKFVDASAITIEGIADGETDANVLRAREEEKRKRTEKLKLVKDETQSQGAVSAAVYMLYIKALGGFTWLLIIVGVYVLAQISEVGKSSRAACVQRDPVADCMVSIAVNLALRYWAQSYDDIETSAKAMFTTTARSPLVHASGSSQAGSRHSPDFWLLMYCATALVCLVLSSLRVSFCESSFNTLCCLNLWSTNHPVSKFCGEAFALQRPSIAC
jgi:hypothetical protein